MALTAAKAKKILEDGFIQGKALTEKQKKFFGAIAGGATPLKKLNGGWLDKFQDGGDVSFDSVQRAVRNVESLDGKLMWNPESTATGLYGQRFSEIKSEYPGTRKEFAQDTIAQKDFFKNRFFEGLPATQTTPLSKDANDLYNEYSSQIPGFDYSKEAIAVLSNFLGRQGTRKYLGNHIRDKKSLEEALPNIYGPDAKQRNKTPDQYLNQAREYYKEGGWLDKYQNGGELNQKYIDSTFNANVDKRWVQRLYEKNPEFYLEGQTKPSTHYMESGDGYVYPRVMEGVDGELKEVSREEGRSQGIKFPNDEIAQWFAKNYKKGTNVLKEYQMGGSLPGATGMMYARTSGLEPKKAQDGTVEYGTPEYEAAYREGRFADVPNQLDEVVINSGVDYNKDIYYDTLTDQEKDLYHNDFSPIGNAVRRKAYTKRGLAEDALAIPGQLLQGAGEAMQMPQSAMVEGIEAIRGNEYDFANSLPGSGKQRAPSETMGFETTDDMSWYNPKVMSNFAMDMFADPSNIVGAGVADDVLKLGLKQGLKKAAVSNVDNIKNIGKNVKEIQQIPNSIRSFVASKVLDNAKVNPKQLKNLYNNRILDEQLIAPNVQSKGITDLPDAVVTPDQNFLNIGGRMYYNSQSNLGARLIDNTKNFIPKVTDSRSTIKYKNKMNKLYDINENAPSLYDGQYFKHNFTSQPIDDFIIHNDRGNINDQMKTSLNQRTWWQKSTPYRGMAPASPLSRDVFGRHLYARQSALEASIGRPLNTNRELIGDVVREGKLDRNNITITPTKESDLYNIEGLEQLTMNPVTGVLERGIFTNSPTRKITNTIEGIDPLKTKEQFRTDILQLDSIKNLKDQAKKGNLKSHLKMLAENEGLNIEDYSRLIDNIDVDAFSKTGKLQMGGSLPGASGMMYARTSGTSPEEPKKAQDGGWLDKFQEGGNVATVSQYEEPAWYEKVLDYAASPMTTLGYLARGEDLPDRLPINVPGRSEYDNWNFDGYNPAAWIKYGASARRNFEEGEYLDSAFDALSAIPILPAFLKRGKKPVKDATKAVKNVVKDVETEPLRDLFFQPNIYPTSSPLPKNMEPYLSKRVYPFNKEQEIFESFLPTEAQLKNIDLKSIRYDADGNIIPNMEYGGEIDKAQWGAFLKFAKKYGSEAVDYLKGFESEGKRTIRNFIEKDLGVKDKLVKKVDVPGTNVKIEAPTTLARTLDNIGLQHVTGRSSYLPSWAQRADDKRLIAVAQSPNIATKHTELIYDPKGKYYTFPEAFMDNPLTAGRTFKALEDFVPKGGILKQGPEGTLSTDSFKLMLNRLKSGKFSDVTNYNDPNVSRYLNTYGNKYKVDVEDYGNLYDPINRRLTAHKFTQQQTQDILNDLEQGMFNLQKQGKVGEGFTGFGIRSLDRGFNEIGIPNLSIRKNYQEGGVIEDDRGQWAYPGEITKINSNNITMKGVNYPVLGISDTGDTKMMQPGVENYTFDGNSVTEFPMAQKGMNVEGQKQKKWFDSYLRSDKYLERLGKEFPEMNADQLANERWARLMNMRSTPIGFLPESSEISPTPGDVQGVHNADEYPGKIMLRPEYSEGRQGPWSYNTIPLHEMGHAVDEGGERIPQTTLDFLMPKLKQNSYGIPKEKYYYTDPTEYINRLQPLRYLLQEEGIYDTKKKDFTKEDLQKAKENTRIKYNRHFKDLMENTESEEDFIKIMNTIAANPQMQQSTTVAQDGKNIQQLDEVIVKNDLRNSPKWKAYQDSLDVYNKSEKLIDDHAYNLASVYDDPDVLDTYLNFKENYAFYKKALRGESGGIGSTGNLKTNYPDFVEYQLKSWRDYLYGPQQVQLSELRKQEIKTKIEALEKYKNMANNTYIQPVYASTHPELIISPRYKKPTKPKETPLKTLVKPEGYKFYNPTAEPISALPEFAVKEVPYNISMQRFPGEEQDGFRYGKDGKGNLVKIQTREDYRSKNRRPNGKEYKNGGALAELDQLTNFTNYNTPQPGGWLDKYQ